MYYQLNKMHLHNQVKYLIINNKNLIFHFNNMFHINHTENH